MELPRLRNLQYFPFAVDTQPKCIWDRRLAEANVQLLESIDDGYFDHVASTVSEKDEETDKYTATAARLAYSHALETLFALLASYTQAPHCPLGWLLAYHNAQLTSVVRKIDSGRGLEYSALKVVPSWHSLSELIHAPLPDEAMRASLVEGFADTWARFADDFMSESFSEEYNSLKHGLRSILGGSTFSITASNPISDDGANTWTSGSLHGSTFYRRRRLKPSSRHFAIEMQSMNWTPSTLAMRLNLAAMSIHNVVNTLKRVSGSKEVSLRYPEPYNAEAFQEPWLNVPSISNLKFGWWNFELAHVEDFTATEIFSVYAGSPTSRHESQSSSPSGPSAPPIDGTEPESS